MSRNGEDEDGEGSGLPEKKSVEPKVVVRFIVELLIVVALSVLAYFLRFHISVFEPTVPLLTCKIDIFDVTEEYVDDTTFVSVLFAAPISAILAGELLLWAFGFHSAGKIGQLLLRRLIRFEGCFYLGLMLTSIITDTTSLLIIKPTPLFYSDCLSPVLAKCPKPWINISECSQPINDSQYNYYFHSFPNYRSAASSYAAVFIAWYFHVVFRASRNNILCPLISASCALLCLVSSLSDFAARRAYWEDITVGLLFGIATALYMVVVVNWFDGSDASDESQQQCDDKKNQQNNVPVPTGAIPRVQAINKGFYEKQLGDNEDNTMSILRRNTNHPAPYQPAVHDSNDPVHQINTHVHKNRILAYDTSTF